MTHSFGHYVSIINKYQHIWINERLEHLGIGSGQFAFINHISRNEGISQKDLSRRVVVDKATTAKAVRKLIDRGYIEKRVNETDNRIHNLFLTERGWEILPELKRVRRENSEVLKEGMSVEEEELVEKILKKMLKNISFQISSHPCCMKRGINE
ncbi:MAG: winged helix-turn-helix transcriptional regulator [Spirochaetales bacterium]|nr:winged helix-turn-helix transcriptional regulator [Spirochaetales bacterium]